MRTRTRRATRLDAPFVASDIVPLDDSHGVVTVREDGASFLHYVWRKGTFLDKKPLCL